MLFNLKIYGKRVTNLNQIARGGVEDTRPEAKETKKIRGQGHPFRGQTLSRPRIGMLEAKTKDTSASILKKKVFKKYFGRSPVKNAFKKFFQAIYTNFQQFKKKCCPRAEDRPIFEDLRLQGQGQGLDLRGQGLQNVSSRTSSRSSPLQIACLK